MNKEKSSTPETWSYFLVSQKEPFSFWRIIFVKKISKKEDHQNMSLLAVETCTKKLGKKQ